MRFARDGSLGLGNYFAINSSYSTSATYAYVADDGMKGVFLAKVLIGDPAKTVDMNRKMPPLKNVFQN